MVTQHVTINQSLQSEKSQESLNVSPNRNEIGPNDKMNSRNFEKRNLKTYTQSSNQKRRINRNVR